MNRFSFVGHCFLNQIVLLLANRHDHQLDGIRTRRNEVVVHARRVDMAHLRHDRHRPILVVLAAVGEQAATVLRQSFIWVVNCQIRFQRSRRIELVQPTDCVRRLTNYAG
ncbi:MAG: hypothetical protein ACK55Z_12720 [bacterium]